MSDGCELSFNCHVYEERLGKSMQWEKWVVRSFSHRSLHCYKSQAKSVNCDSDMC